MRSATNPYQRQLTNAQIKAGAHRNFVGGRWDEIGKLQFDFLGTRGLMREHKLLDIGCGALRGGIHFVDYLNRGNYYGLDINNSLIEAGKHELARAGLTHKNPHLAVSESFELQPFGEKFDYLLAISVFTHVYANQILSCLAAARAVLASDGTFFATFFAAPHSIHVAPIIHEPRSVKTEYDRDPFHYSVEEIQAMAKLADLSVEIIGEWNHPCGQQMLAFSHRTDGGSQHPSPSVEAIMEQPLPNLESLGLDLRPGDVHYRAYVGPPTDYDLVAAMTFNLLTTLGLRQHHSLLDVGCGSLRIGRLLIPYLNEGNYFGIEPNKWLVEEGIRREVGGNLLQIKRPKFLFSDSPTALTDAQASFDFAVAQSIFSHCGLNLVRRWLSGISTSLASGGVLLATFLPAEEDTARSGWIYPDCVHYRPATLRQVAAEANLSFQILDWKHPRQQWALFATREFDATWFQNKPLTWNTRLETLLSQKNRQIRA